MMELALDLANITQEECTAENVQRIIVENNINTMGNLRPDNFILAREDICGGSIKRLYYLSDWLGEKHRHRNSSVPTDPDYLDGLWAVVSDVKDALSFAFSCFENRDMINLDWLNQIYHQTTPKGIYFMSGDDEWEPDFIPDHIGGDTSFYYVVLRKVLVDTFIQKKGKEFLRIRRCLFCKKFLYARDLRTGYCSTQCKNKDFYRKSKESSARELEILREITAPLKNND